ncbi:MAG: formylglycine-generating enzyme family protein [Rhodospirillaceae bacterium]|nr:formylglycine-generating enzyme family protein [Rhodospirillaceae bacterium]
MPHALRWLMIIGCWLWHPFATQAQATFKDCALCPEMVVVPAGSFEMGATKEENLREQSPERYIDWESPIRTVTIPRPFAVGATEVTRAQFSAFVDDAKVQIEGCDIAKGNDWDRRADKSWRDPGFAQEPDEPVVCVNWSDAKAYIDWLSAKTGKPYRLLTEAEWEYVARAGTPTARFWGDGRDEACRYANVPDAAHVTATQNHQGTFTCNDGYASTSPARTFQPNAFGIYDTIGNVWEWVDDCFHDSYRGAPGDSASWQPDPACAYHVARGGSWNPRLATQLRSAARGRVTTTLRNSNLGFRVAVTP